MAVFVRLEAEGALSDYSLFSLQYKALTSSLS